MTCLVHNSGSVLLNASTPHYHKYNLEGPLEEKRSVEPDHSRLWSVPFKNGLWTPPEDMAGVAVKPPVDSGYGSRYTLHSQPFSHAQAMPSVSVALDGTNSLHSQRKQHPPSQTTQIPDVDQQKGSGNSIAPYLQIPSSINNSKGSLAEFAAQITCLFWFEKASKLLAIENSGSSHYPIPTVPESVPTIGFRKWVTTILSTTQVSQNVILLALLFIYRLKKSNPNVRGKRGSEYRLMTIALMMGNKFLDDNTYTNKTWAEVTGISVQEIHIMEVEFLSNVRYNLFVSKREWDEWHGKLGVFAAFFDRASMLPLETSNPPTPTTYEISPNLTPTSPRYPKLPSPPVSSAHPTPMQWKQPLSQPVVGSSYPKLSPPRDILPVNRKRPWDGSMDEHPSKRMAHAPTNVSLPTPLPSLPTMVPANSHVPAVTVSSVPQLNVPPTTAPLPQIGRQGVPVTTAPAGQQFTSAPVQANQLPPVNRAMGLVYPPANNWNQYNPPTTLTPLSTSFQTTSGSFHDQSRRQSPFPVTTANNSPTLSTYSIHTPTRLSPSALLDRNSPYRPVRSVNTLLYPPPSASMHHHRPLPNVQMHYQPLGKAVSERKTGVLPYFSHDVWNDQHLQPIVPPTVPSYPAYRAPNY